MVKFGVSEEVTALGLSLYVLAYGLGPLLFSPLSEVPSIGRNPPYMVSFGIFVILCVPTALVTNVPGLMVLRFLTGFFGSPCLATGGASLQDMYSLIKLPYVLCLWAFAATCGPAMGPVISGFSVPAENWHWSLWEVSNYSRFYSRSAADKTQLTRSYGFLVQSSWPCSSFYRKLRVPTSFSAVRAVCDN